MVEAPRAYRIGDIVDFEPLENDTLLRGVILKKEKTKYQIKHGIDTYTVAEVNIKALIQKKPSK